MYKHTPTYIQLSPEAFAELKKVCIDEYGDTLSDFEINEMGSRLLNLFAIFAQSEANKGEGN